MISAASDISSPVGVIAAVAPCRFAGRIRLASAGSAPVLFALRAPAIGARRAFSAITISVGQLGRATKLFRRRAAAT